MKKFLSLVLALVMTMSLVTVSAGAKDFADDSDIDYKAAVDVISELGVVDGYSDDTFRPDGLLTRGAAAKIICNLILGPTTASALSASTAPLKDVPTTNVFAGYITYCAQQGIISGYGDGTFRPTGTLSGNAFMKMLLGALGYSSSIEHYTGANWQVNVIKQASGIGLDDGNDSFVGSNPVTRGEAALYAYNMLQATMVEYSNTSSVVVGDITVNTSATRSEVANTSTRTDGNIEEDELMQFAERYFTDLVKGSGTDTFGRPATVWELDGEEIGTYGNEADHMLVVDKAITYNDLMIDDADYFSLRSSDFADDVTVYMNGDKVKSTDYDTEEYFVAGDVVELFDNDDNDIATVVVTRYSLAKIDGIDDDLSASLERQGASYAIDLVDLFSGAGFANATGTYYDNHDNESVELKGFNSSTYTEGTVLAVVANSDSEILASHVAEEVTGTVSRYNSGSKASITVGGEAYPVTAQVKGQFASFSFNDAEYTLYVNADGYVVGYETSGSVTIEDVYYITGVVLDTSGRYDEPEYYAQAVALDGTVSEIELEADSFAGLVSVYDGSHYYMQDSAGTYYDDGDGTFSNSDNGSGIKYAQYSSLADVAREGVGGGHVLEGSGAGTQRIRSGGAKDQVADDLGGRPAGQQIVGAEGVVAVAIDNAQFGNHVDSGIIVNVAVVREVRGARADGDQGHGHDQSKHQRKELLHGDSSYF